MKFPELYRKTSRNCPGNWSVCLPECLRNSPWLFSDVSRKSTGNALDSSGHVQEMAKQIYEIPGKVKEISGNFLRYFRAFSGKFRGNFPEHFRWHSRKFLGNFKEIPRTKIQEHSGKFLGNSRMFPGKFWDLFRDFSREFRQICWEFSRTFPGNSGSLTEQMMQRIQKLTRGFPGHPIVASLNRTMFTTESRQRCAE